MDVSILKGKILTKIQKSEGGECDYIYFHTSDWEAYSMHHRRDCCESVFIEDICGNLEDLLNSPILIAEERTNENIPPLSEIDKSFTWTFYEFATVKGSVTIRWYGTSNGYYSESVDFELCHFVEINKMVKSE